MVSLKKLRSQRLLSIIVLHTFIITILRQAHKLVGHIERHLMVLILSLLFDNNLLIKDMLLDHIPPLLVIVFLRAIGIADVSGSYAVIDRPLFLSYIMVDRYLQRALSQLVLISYIVDVLLKSV